MINLIIKNPFISTFMTCLLFFLTAGMFFGNTYVDSICINYILISIAFIFLQKKFIEYILSAWIVLLILALNLFVIKNDLILLLTEIGFTFYFIYKNKNNSSVVTFFIIATSFFIHLFYVQKTNIDFLQHDLSGIIAYMTNISENGFAWKSFNPWYMYYTFHQPLSFLIAQYIYLFGIKLWISSMVAFEGIQYISLFYTTALSILFAKILYILKFRGILYYGLLTLFTFNPTLTLFSGYISNDVAVLFWILFTIYYVLYWYKTSKLKYISIAGMGFGLGVLSKLSILILVPAISILFLLKLINSPKKHLIIKGISLFIIITVPISLSWIIRNHILFDMQFYNIPDTSPEGQNFKLLTLFDRITDFSMFFSAFINAPKVVDANMVLAIIKTELFGEWDFSLLNKNVIIPSYILYYINIILKAFVFYGCFYLLVKHRMIKNSYVLLFIVIYLSSYLYMFNYAIKYPYICSTDYRLFASLMVAECMILGYLSRNDITFGRLIFVTSIIYAMLSSIIYIMII